jgi:glycerate dehydrogenase
MPQIVYLDYFTLANDPTDLNIFSSLGNFKIYPRTSIDQIIERAKNADIIMTNKCPLDAETIAALPKLKFVAVTATGYNIIDIAAAKAKGILVANAATYSTASVAQQTMAMILAFSNRLAEHADPVKWATQEDFCYYDFPLYDLESRTLGLIGYGMIAQKVAALARAFGMKVIYYKRSKTDFGENQDEAVSLDDLLTRSDFVSLHCPLSPDNMHMFNKSTFKKMQPHAVLINTARGQLIHESDLREALDHGEIGGAYLDVLSVEPPSLNHILYGAKNLKISPHIAWASVESRKRLIKIVYENISSFLVGKPINIVNQ